MLDLANTAGQGLLDRLDTRSTGLVGTLHGKESSMNIPADRAQDVKDWLYDPNSSAGRYYASKVERIACPYCLGSGKYAGYGEQPCAYCEGTGKGIL